ncbi:hypothetical protein UFOVP168_8 [uncultured Caudovirales phage]|uniref:Uncharacterized protein n=1 Tax=uncultured Caudovirales phage TaxID=2100421 RepID=A0A6J7WBV2_9CAUD|nr:hypothetical protein UFOVP168_8 [uncultured Caudovirales phage]
MKNKRETYDWIVEAVHLAVESEQQEEGAPFKRETEMRLHTVYTLLREALGIKASDS